MGIEFLTRTRKTITKHIDRMRVELATPDLFTQQPADLPRCAMLTLKKGATVEIGDQLVLEATRSSVTAHRNNVAVGNYDNPSADILESIAKTGGTAGGVVRRVMKISGKAKVSLC